MILTANRYFTVDTAFDPHINLALPFKEPDAAARAKIWRNFINRSVAASALTDGDLAPLAKVPLNGRHIQGAFKTACVLAARRRVPLNIEHLQTVIEARHRAARLLGGGGV